MINLSGGSPSWTDILQAFAAAIGIPLTIFTLLKLVIKDKQRDSEIKSLSTVADQLTNMQIENEKRYKSSKKPHLGIKLVANLDSKNVKLDFTNSNSNTSITAYKVNDDSPGSGEYNITRSGISSDKGFQFFWIVLSSQQELFEYAVLHMDYSTEEGYVFIQDIIIWLEGETYVLSPSAIIDQQNSPVK